MSTEADPRHLLGRRAEALVCERLRRVGYVIVAQNARVGRAELDIIAERAGLFVFCEVRARSSDFVSPLETLDRRKLRRVREAALSWMSARGLSGRAMRFDAAAVTMVGGELSVDYREGAF